MFPYRDENGTARTPIVTMLIIALNAAVWLFLQGAGRMEPLAASVCNLGLIPGELTGLARVGDGFALGPGVACLIDAGRAPSHIFTSMFMHASWSHLLGNMWFLWVFGKSVEDSMGRLRFGLFYLVAGLAAAFAQVALMPSSIYPMVGASGAISGVMGGYLLLYPRVRVFTLVWLGIFLTTVALPAWVMLGYWAVLQLLGSFGGLDNGVAFAAHVGGFLSGMLLVKLFARRDLIAEHLAHPWRPRRVGFGF